MIQEEIHLTSASGLHTHTHTHVNTCVHYKHYTCTQSTVRQREMGTVHSKNPHRRRGKTLLDVMMSGNASEGLKS